MKKIGPLLIKNMLTLAEAYAEAKDVHLSTVSRMAHGEPSFFEVLKGNVPRRPGGPLPSATFRKYDDVMEWFAVNWPVGVPKPKIWDPFPGANRRFMSPSS